MANNSFYCWETYPLTITVRNEGALDDAAQIVVSFAQAGNHVDLTGDRLAVDAANGTIQLTLTQAETGIFAPGNVAVQVNVLYEDSERDTSGQATLTALDNVYRKEMQA